MVSSLWRFANVIERCRHGVTRIFTGGLDVSPVRRACRRSRLGSRVSRAQPVIDLAGPATAAPSPAGDVGA